MAGGFSNKTNTGTALTATELLWVQTGDAGVILLTETTAPSATAGVGKLYVKSSDSKLYFKDDSGVEVNLSDAAAGSGTVTSVSVVTANGVSGSVATATTTPAITIVLGAITPSAVQVSGLTASEIVITDGSKNLVSAAVATYPSLTELTYVKGVTSAIQTQINTKAPSTAPTFATSITGSYLTASEMLITDGSKNIVSAAVATYPSLTQLTYLKGVTSAIQTQLDAKQATITFGTGVQTALGVNIGSAGAPVLFNGALGTPSSGVATNLTGTASGLTAGNVTTNANLTGHVTSTGNATVLGSFTMAQLDTAISDGNAAYLGAAQSFTALQTYTLAGVTNRMVNTTDAASVQIAKFEGDRATMAANDEAYNSYHLSDSAGNQDEMARITWRATTVTSTSEVSRLAFSVVTAGALAEELYLTGTALSPAADGGNSLGTTALGWQNLFANTGFVLNIENADWVATHTAGILTVGTGDLRVTTAGTNTASVVTVGGAQTLTSKVLTSATITTLLSPTSNDGAALGNTTNQFSDLFLAEGGVINWDNGDVTLTQTNNVLALAGAEFTFGANTAYFTETDNGNSSTADTIDWKLGNKQKSTLTGNCTFTFTAPSGPCSLVLKLAQDATGSRTVTWPATVHWSGGVAPTLTTTASRIDIITFYWDGTTYFGNYSLNFVA